MSADTRTHIRVVKPGDVVWEEALRGPDDTEPPGEEFTVVNSEDDRFSFGLWRREAQNRHFERQYHEIAFIMEGEVELTDDDGTVHLATAGDIVVTPQGSRGHWRNLTPVKKVWAVYEETRAELNAYTGPGPF
jgi:uncharacterized cupin superfamily protein